MHAQSSLCQIHGYQPARITFELTHCSLCALFPLHMGGAMMALVWTVPHHIAKLWWAHNEVLSSCFKPFFYFLFWHQQNSNMKVVSKLCCKMNSQLDSTEFFYFHHRQLHMKYTHYHITLRAHKPPPIHCCNTCHCVCSALCGNTGILSLVKSEGRSRRGSRWRHFHDNVHRLYHPSPLSPHSPLYKSNSFHLKLRNSWSLYLLFVLVQIDTPFHACSILNADKNAFSSLHCCKSLTGDYIFISLRYAYLYCIKFQRPASMLYVSALRKDINQLITKVSNVPRKSSDDIFMQTESSVIFSTARFLQLEFQLIVQWSNSAPCEISSRLYVFHQCVLSSQ